MLLEIAILLLDRLTLKEIPISILNKLKVLHYVNYP